jgi:hypothetical protein
MRLAQTLDPISSIIARDFARVLFGVITMLPWINATTRSN